MSLLRDLFGWHPPDLGNSSSRTQRVSTSYLSRTTTSTLRNTERFHEERGWRLRGNALEGYYRTRFGSFEGAIQDPFGLRPDFLIQRPPLALLSGPHGACFLPVNGDTFRVHWNTHPTDIDTGIRRIEHCILEALS